ncbi:MAG: hypothetical protein ACSW8J_10555 [bacterium]
MTVRAESARPFVYSAFIVLSGATQVAIQLIAAAFMVLMALNLLDISGLRSIVPVPLILGFGMVSGHPRAKSARAAFARG